MIRVLESHPSSTVQHSQRGVDPSEGGSSLFISVIFRLARDDGPIVRRRRPSTEPSRSGVPSAPQHGVGDPR